jgi:nucleoside-diphosphate-sugar epimerase
MSTPTKIYVAGHRGMVGSAIVRHLQKNGIASEARQSTQIITRTSCLVVWP